MSSYTNFAEYLQSLQIKIKSLKQDIDKFQQKITEIEKEFGFRKSFLEKEIKKELNDYESQGLGLSLPHVNLQAINITDEDIKQVLYTIFKIEN